MEDEKSIRNAKSEPEKEERKVLRAEDFTLEKFEKEFRALNDKGRRHTLKHKEMFPAPKKDKDGKIINDSPKGGRRYHAPGSDPKCPYCKQLIDNFNEMMMMETDLFGVTGIQFDNLWAAIKITRATVIMMDNEKRIKEAQPFRQKEE